MVRPRRARVANAPRDLGDRLVDSEALDRLGLKRSPFTRLEHRISRFGFAADASAPHIGAKGLKVKS
jgi:hypothetical protein